MSAKREYPEWMGKMRGLNAEELKEFLDGPVVARIATVDSKGDPYITPGLAGVGRGIDVGDPARENHLRPAFAAPSALFGVLRHGQHSLHPGVVSRPGRSRRRTGADARRVAGDRPPDVDCVIWANAVRNIWSLHECARVIWSRSRRRRRFPGKASSGRRSTSMTRMRRPPRTEARQQAAK